MADPAWGRASEPALHLTDKPWSAADHARMTALWNRETVHKKLCGDLHSRLAAAPPGPEATKLDEQFRKACLAYQKDLDEADVLRRRWTGSGKPMVKQHVLAQTTAAQRSAPPYDEIELPAGTPVVWSGGEDAYTLDGKHWVAILHPSDVVERGSAPAAAAPQPAPPPPAPPAPPPPPARPQVVNRWGFVEAQPDDPVDTDGTEGDAHGAALYRRRLVGRGLGRYGDLLVN